MGILELVVKSHKCVSFLDARTDPRQWPFFHKPEFFIKRYESFFIWDKCPYPLHYLLKSITVTAPFWLYRLRDPILGPQDPWGKKGFQLQQKHWTTWVVPHLPGKGPRLQKPPLHLDLPLHLGEVWDLPDLTWSAPTYSVVLLNFF